MREIAWGLSGEIRWSQSRKSTDPHQRKSRIADHAVLEGRGQLVVNPLHGPGAASRNVRQRYGTPRPATTAVQRDEVEVRDPGIYEHVLTNGAATALSEAA
jgi:hypothetical protein